MSTTSQYLSSTVIPLLLTLPPLYFLYSLVFPTIAPLPTASRLPPSSHHDSYNWMPAAGRKCALLQDYTPKQLAKFDGKQEGGQILLAIKGQVFDVTSGRNFYGPDGAYGNFAGRDASRGMAKQSFDEDMLTPVDQPLDTLYDLSASDIENMEGWVEHFQRKYIVCGQLVENSS